MAVQIIMLRGVNLGKANRVAMPALRTALAEAGFEDVRTYVQSGNIALEAGRLGTDKLITRVTGVLDDGFGIRVPIVARSAKELAATVEANPFPEQAKQQPKLLQVTFRSEPVTDELLETLSARAADSERIAGVGRELYSWHPDGIARSKLAAGLTGKAAVAATARNWSTVLALLELAGG
jgi:uncharacterized protein (DUF1697 family)